MRKGLGLGRREGEVGVVVRGVLGLIIDDVRRRCEVESLGGVGLIW